MARRTVSLVIIGDEVLSGKVVDANTPYLLRRLRQIGAICPGVRIVGDNVPAIAAAVAESAAAADFVITTGGVGPTHDDVTIDGIAAAFGLTVIEDQRLVALLESHVGAPLRGVQRRLARVPEGAALTPGGGYPTVRVRNVFVFPGIPSLLRQKFTAVESALAGDRLVCVALRTELRETELAPFLEATLATHPAIAIGSYPRSDVPGFRVLVTLEGASGDEVRAALCWLERALPMGPVEILDPFHPEDNGGLTE